MEKTIKHDTDKQRYESKITDLDTELKLYKHEVQELEKKAQ